MVRRRRIRIYHVVSLPQPEGCHSGAVGYGMVLLRPGEGRGGGDRRNASHQTAPAVDHIIHITGPRHQINVSLYCSLSVCVGDN